MTIGLHSDESSDFTKSFKNKLNKRGLSTSPCLTPQAEGNSSLMQWLSYLINISGSLKLITCVYFIKYTSGLGLNANKTLVKQSEIY